MKIQKTKLPTVKQIKSINIKSLEDKTIVAVMLGTKDIELLKTMVTLPTFCAKQEEDFVQILKNSIEENKFTGYSGESAFVKYITKTGKCVCVGFFGYELKDEDKILPQDKHLYDFKILFNKIGTSVYSFAKAKKAKNILVISSLPENLKENTLVPCKKSILALVNGAFEASYQFKQYLTKKSSNPSDNNSDETPAEVEKISIYMTEASKMYGELYDECLERVFNKAASVAIVKDLVNYPANDLYPESYADFIAEELKDMKSVKCTIYDKADLQKMDANLLLGVSQGSSKEPRMVILEYKGKPESQEFDVALIGKGVTFDSGGYSLKPAQYMMDMKSDMAGSATVFGTILAVAKNKVPSNVVGVMVLTENMVNGEATRPGDIQFSMSGQSVEILNTDAEGRLILADAVYYAKTKFNPKHMIDLATLTGAMSVALGDACAGLFSNNDDLARTIEACGVKTGDFVWRMPMWKCYNQMLGSKIADMKNISNTGTAGSITGAKFIERFIDNHKSWAHLDIANVAFFCGKPSTSGKINATGFGVHLLVDFIKTTTSQNL